MQVRHSVGILMITSILCVAGDVQAQIFRSWNDAGGGSYGNPFNWSPSGVPTVDDGAGFGLNSMYGVTFPINETTGIVSVSAGNVSFSLNSSGVARTLTIPGTLTINSGVLFVYGGAVDPGELVIENDGNLIVQGNASVPTGDIPVTVTGQFSDWTIVSGFTRVGEFATGSLLIEDGASVFNDH